MSTFDDEFAEGTALDLLAEFGELITYTPNGGSPRTITAIVVRNPAKLLSTIQDVVSARLVIRVLDDSADATYGGVSMATWDSGGDSIHVAVRKGDTPEDLALNEFVSSNGGMNSFGAN